MEKIREIAVACENFQSKGLFWGFYFIYENSLDCSEK